MTARRPVLLGLGAAVGLALTGLAPVRAQPALPQPLKLLVGFPPGTGPDVVARLLGQKLGELLKGQVAVDNRTGAGGQIAANAVAKAPADGGTLLLGEVGSIAIAPPAFSKLPYDPARELAVLSEVVRSDFLLVVPTTSPAQSVADFVKAARAKADRTNIATFGAGTPGHFGAEMFAEQAGGFKIEPIHYRATGDAVTAIVAGDVQGAFVSTALGVAQIKGGKMRALATTAAQRSPLLPDVPTFTEAGLPKVDFSAWFAVFVPAATPAAVQDLLATQVAAAVRAPEVRQKLVDAGFTVTGTSRAEAERMVRAEAPRWAAVVKASGFKGD
ncbi:tripartite tricarboxylate transporter substrate-binding protein [Piscinibacter sakaiensis]|uniref:Putative exported protein n=1 Tax=Piscinibacter sakaiensis TaxID=1547922 RepID=A0A0K8P4P7_PISS1|nr:tripartite tricarboxylate transporter substrate-binding protein [Piscinibacter sakaiensis]GAP37643.1 putative exported protein [Piscinibacter sakaiensis]